MNDLRQIQLRGIEELTQCLARLDHAVENAANSRSPFEIEARLYVIKHLADKTVTLAEIVHRQFHKANSEVGV